MHTVHGLKVYGVNVDAQTRCVHYHSKIDIIAIKFKCCGKWFPCFDCHGECSDHAPEKWRVNEYATRAILCGNCGYLLTVEEYLKCDSICPKCRSNFNPGCTAHYDLYFELSITD